jgi:DHA1 family bicyclomycin/chloramphenicol resistance-like MFS transporter
MFLAVFNTLWFAVRQAETLTRENKKDFSLTAIRLAFREVLTHKAVIGYTLAQGFIFGAFLSYISAAQAIYEQAFNIVDDFPKYFAAMAGSFGVAAFLNSRLVMKFGMLKIIRTALISFTILSSGLLIIALFSQGIPPLGVFICLAMPLFFSMSLMFGNLNSIAMQPMGHMAGVGASVIGFISMLVSVLCSILIGRQFNGTLTPFFVGCVIVGLLAIITVRFAHRAAPNIGN